PCEEPRSCAGANRSMPSARKPLRESSRRAALPITPRPQTTTSKLDITARKIHLQEVSGVATPPMHPTCPRHLLSNARKQAAQCGGLEFVGTWVLSTLAHIRIRSIPCVRCFRTPVSQPCRRLYSS